MKLPLSHKLFNRRLLITTGIIGFSFGVNLSYGATSEPLMAGVSEAGATAAVNLFESPPVLEADLLDLGWHPEVLQVGNTHPAHLRRIHQFQLKPTDATAAGETLVSLICNGLTLREDWIKRLEAFIQENVFNPNIVAHSDTALIAELKQLNPDHQAFINDDLYPRLQEIQAKFREKLDFNKEVCEWTEREVNEWCKEYKSFKGDVKKAKLTELLAVIMRAAQLTQGYKEVPRSNQLLAVLSAVSSDNIKGRFLQVATGEGKSTITAMTAAVHALRGKYVDIVSSSSELSQRDAREQKDFFQSLGLDCAGPERSGRKIQEIINNYKTKPVIYSTLLELQGDILSEVRGGRPYNVLLLDEVDSMLVDRMSELTQIVTPLPGMEHFFVLKTFIWRGLIAAKQRLLSDAEIREELLTSARKALRGEYEDEFIVIPERLRAFAEFQIPTWIDSALQALNHQEDKEHIINSNGDIRPVDYEHTGVVQTRQHYGDGVHQFLQLKHMGYLVPEGLLSTYMSTLTLLDRYKGGVYGLTGTLGDTATQQFFHNICNVDCMRIPSFSPKQFKEYPVTISDEQSQWHADILQSTIEEATFGRGVLVLFETIAELNAFKAQLLKYYPADKVFSYSRNDIDGMFLERIPGTLAPGQIILSTNLSGRGTDIKLQPSIEVNCGLHVCMTFFPLNDRVEAQGFGRTARKGQKGSCELILCKAQLNAKGLIYANDSATLSISDLRRRRERRVQQRLIDKQYAEAPQLRQQDCYYAQIHECLHTLRGGAKNFREGAYTLDNAKLDHLMELWALQYQMIRTYGKHVYTEQTMQLHAQVDRLGYTLDTPRALTHRSLYELVVDYVDGITADELEHQVLSYLWNHVAASNRDYLREIVPQYLGDTAQLLKLISQIIKRTLVIVNQTGQSDIYRHAGENPIVIGCITGGDDAPSTFAVPAHWTLYNTLEGGDSLYHAMLHQLSLKGHPIPDREQSNIDDARHLRAYIEEDSPIADEEEELAKIAKRLNCIVAVAKAEALDEGYTYTYYEGGSLVVSSSRAEGLTLPDQTVYRVYRTEHLTPANAFKDEPEVRRVHFQSVIVDPFTPSLDTALLGSVYDVIPHYRGLHPVLITPSKPTHLPCRYARLYVKSDADLTELNTAIAAANVSPPVSLDAQLSRDAAEFATVQEVYTTAIQTYYQQHIEAEKNYIKPVMKVFLEESQKRFNSNSLIVSAAALIPLISKESCEILRTAFKKSIETDPLLRYVAYYGLAQMLIEKRPTNYEQLALSALRAAEEAVVDGKLPWEGMMLLLSFEREEGFMERIKEAPMAKQLFGRLGFFKGLHANITQNIERINTKTKGYSIELGDPKNWITDFKAFGVLEEDLPALKSIGIPSLYTLEECPPGPTFGDLLGMAVLGVLQAAGGALLVCTGFGASLGVSLFNEGLKDIYQSVKSGLCNEAINWGRYWLNKGISALLSITGAAWSAIQKGASIAKDGGMGFAQKVGTEIVGETGAIAAEKAAETLLIQGVRSVVIQTVAAETVNYVRTQAIKGLKKTIQEEANSAISTLESDGSFKAELSQLMAFDCGTQRKWKVVQTVQEGMSKWAESYGRKTIEMVIKVIKAMDSAHSTQFTAKASIVSQLALWGWNAVSFGTFCTDYVDTLKAKVKAAASNLRTLDVVLTDVSKAKPDTAKAWVAAAEGAGLLKGSRPYYPAVEGGDGLISVRDVTPMILSFTSQPQFREEEALRTSGHSVLFYLNNYYTNEGKEPRLDVFKAHLRGLFTEEIDKGVMEQMSELATQWIGKGMTSMADIVRDGLGQKRIQDLNEKAKTFELTEAEQKERYGVQERLDQKKELRLKEKQESGVALTPEEKQWFNGYHQPEIVAMRIEEKKRVGWTLRPEEEEWLDGYTQAKADADRIDKEALAQTEAQRTTDENEYDSIMHLLRSNLNQLQTPEQQFNRLRDIMQIPIDGFTLDEMMSEHPEFKDNRTLQKKTIQVMDSFMANTANFIEETYQNFKAENPHAAKVMEWTLEKSMTMLYVASMCTPAGLVAAGSIAVANHIGLNGYVKEKLKNELKSYGFERSAEGISLLLTEVVESKVSGKLGTFSGRSIPLNDMFQKVENEVVKKIHGNSLQSKKTTHIYEVTKNGKPYKIGESGQGLNALGQSKRAEEQVRRLNRENPGAVFESEVLRTYPDKATARKFETELIRKRKSENPDALPGNKTNR